MVFAEDIKFRAAYVTPGQAKCIVKVPSSSALRRVLEVLLHLCFSSLCNQAGRELTQASELLVRGTSPASSFEKKDS